MVEKKKEEQKKRKSIIEEYLDIQKNLSLTENLHKVIMQSSSGIRELAESIEAHKIGQATLALQAMSSVEKAIREMALQQASVMRSIQASPVIEAIAQCQRMVQSLVQNYQSINRLVQSIPKVTIPKVPPLVLTKIGDIPPQVNDTVRSLLRYIGVLEKELAKKEAENKELLRILDERKKKLRKMYVA